MERKLLEIVVPEGEECASYAGEVRVYLFADRSLGFILSYQLVQLFFIICSIEEGTKLFPLTPGIALLVKETSRSLLVGKYCPEDSSRVVTQLLDGNLRGFEGLKGFICSGKQLLLTGGDDLLSSCAQCFDFGSTGEVFFRTKSLDSLTFELLGKLTQLAVYAVAFPIFDGVCGHLSQPGLYVLIASLVVLPC